MALGVAVGSVAVLARNDDVGIRAARTATTMNVLVKARHSVPRTADEISAPRLRTICPCASEVPAIGRA